MNPEIGSLYAAPQYGPPSASPALKRKQVQRSAWLKKCCTDTVVSDDRGNPLPYSIS
jgi:hypothetical protein